MSKFKKGLMKRVLAVILSGAMVMSNMTAFASEAPADTSGYVEEVADDVDGDDSTGSESADEEEVEDNAEVESISEDAATEETTKSEDNASNGNDDADNEKKTEVETVETEDTEASDEEQASETESFLSTEEEETDESQSTEEDESGATEEEDRNEDIKADFKEMEFSNETTSYVFNAVDIANNIAANATVVTNDGAFELICGGSTAVDATKESKFYYWDSEAANGDNKGNRVADTTTTKAVNLGSDASKNCAIKFQVSQAVDVTVYWVANAVDSQMSILDDDGKVVIKTREVPVDSKPNKRHISTMTLNNAGTYYLGGNNKVYKVRVEPKTTKRTFWDFTTTDKNASGYVSGTCDGAEGDAAMEYFDLRIDANIGKFKPNAQNVQTNNGVIFHVPVGGRSKVTFKMNNTSYRVDGVDAQAVEDTFTCVGEGGYQTGGYATLEVTGASQYLNKITVVPVQPVGISGTVTLTTGTLNAGTQVVFTEDTTRDLKTVIKADIGTDGKYSTELYKGVKYKVSFSEKGYSISEGGTIDIGENETNDQTLNITASSMTTETVKGTITFPAGKKIPSDLKLEFTAVDGSHTTEEMTLNGTEYSVDLKPSTTYNVTVIAGTRINDYVLKTESVNSSNKDITFEKKEEKSVNVTVKTIKTGGIKEIDLSNTKIIFTNVNEKGYTYEFTGTNNIQLRAGTYKITEMNVEYPYWFDFSKQFIVGNEALDTTLEFSERMAWDWKKSGQEKDLMLQENKPAEGADGEQKYHGLLINTKNGKFSVGTGNVQVNNNTIVKIPVSGSGRVNVTVSNSNNSGYTMDGEETTDVTHTWEYKNKPAATFDESGNYTGEYMTLISKGLYLEKIEVERAPETFATEWSFHSGSAFMSTDENKTTIQNETKTLSGLIINAEASGAVFRTEGRDDWAQVNAGTIIKVPVADACRVAVEGYNVNTKYKVDGTANTQKTQVFKSEGTDGYVVIEMLDSPATAENSQAGNFLGSIKIALEADLRTNWNFKAGGDFRNPNIEISNGDIVTADGLEVTTPKNGYFKTTSSTDWAQVSAGTIIRVPVTGASYVTVEGYKDTTKYTVDGQENTKAIDSFECEGTDGWVTIEMQESGSDSYLGSISVEPLGEKPTEFHEGKWNFGSGSDLKVESNNIGDGQKGTIAGLVIDGSENGKGKFNVTSNPTWAQVNAITNIKIPVKGPSKITTVWFGNEIFEIDGQSVTAKDEKTPITLIGKPVNGWITLKVTKGGYIRSIAVEQLPTRTIKGTVSSTEALPSGTKVIFTENTEDASQFVIPATIQDDKSYEATLYVTGNDYTVSLSDNGYNITEPEGGVIPVVANSKPITQNITAEKMAASEVTGTVEYPTGVEIPSDLKLTFTEQVESGTPHSVKNVAVTGGKYTAMLKNNAVYTVTASGTRVDDYEVTSGNLDTANIQNIVFGKKITYPVTLKVTSYDEDALADNLSRIKIVFTNTEDTNYTYPCTGDNIQLRDGTYSALVNAGYPYKPDKAATLEIKGAAKEYALNFTERLKWSFTSDDLNAEDKRIEVGTGKTGELEGLVIEANNGTFRTVGRNSAAQVNEGTVIKIPLHQKSEVTIEGYNAGSSYTVDGKPNTKQTDTFVCEGTDGYAVFEMKKPTDANGHGAYLNSITVNPIKEVVIPDNRKIDVWDFAGLEEEDTNKYNNNITPAIWVESELIQNTGGSNSEGRFKGGSNDSLTHKFGDLLMTYNGQDRIYSNVKAMTDNHISAGDKYVNDYKDGYQSAGAWYVNGCGSETTRNVTIENVAAGDKIIVYAGKHNGDVTYYFEGQGVENTQKEAGPLIGGASPAYQKLVFIAEHTGTYKIYPKGSGSSPKNLYNRIVRIPGAKVSGTVDFKSFNINNYTVKFVNQTTKQETVVDVADDKSFQVSLAPGYTYLAVLSGAPGYGFAAEGKFVTVAEDASTVENVELTVEEKAMYAYSGTIKGFEAGYNTDRLAITMTPPKASNADDVKLTIDKEALSFFANLESGLEYTFQMEGVDDYVVKEPLSVKSSEDLAADIFVELKPRYLVSGGFIGLENEEVRDLTFTLIGEDGTEDANYVYPATVADGGYSVELRDGTYLAKAAVTGYKMQTHVIVDGEAVNKDLLFVSTGAEGSLTRVANLYVGYPGKKNNFKTVSEAVKAAKRMNPKSEAERITIHIAPGTYREQIIVDVPYITFTNDEPSKDVLLTWYYGIGYAYYSVNEKGYYDAQKAHDKYEKAHADRWGCAVRVAASDFRAENIIFENSFSRYITEEEIEDGVLLHPEGTGDSKATYVRHAGSTKKEIQSKAAVERAAAIALDADRAEFYKCTFYGSQDTVYTGSGGVHSYFKDCFIEGNTDFLFGDSNSVYENCKLSFAGYSDTPNKNGGIIAVNQAESEHGYLFWGCTITRGKELDNGFGDLGRPWRANAKVVYVNTIQESADLITEAGWQGMSGASAESNENYKEYNTTLPDGTPITLKEGSIREKKYLQYNPVSDRKVYFDSWTPAYFDYDESKVVKEPVSSDNRSDVPVGTTITLTTATEGARIYYTTDGTDPTAQSAEATAPIELGSEAGIITIKAIAIKGDNHSNIAVFEYTLKDAADLIAAPTATVEAGVVEKGTKVRLTCATEGADIYFTLNGDDPTVKSTLLYKKGQIITINKTTTVKAISEKGGNVSAIAEYEYIVSEPVDAPTASIDSGDVPVGMTVTLTAPGAKIYYTTDGTTPTESSTEYTTPIELGNEAKKVVIKAIAVKNGVKSEVATFTYTVSTDIDPDKFVSAPVSDVKNGEVPKGTKVTLTSATADAKIYYTMDGTDPTAKSTEYAGPIDLGNEAKKVVIKAIAIKDENKSSISTFEYTVTDKPDDPNVPGTVALPTADINPGEVPVGMKVTLTAPGAKIYYTLDETTPTESSTEYTAPIELGNEAKTIVIKAIAVKDGVKSEVATFTYTVSTDIDPDKFVSAPVSDVAQGEVPKGTKVTLTSATTDAKIYYTMDGTDPTAKSTEYAGPIELGNEAKKVVIKAIAIKGDNKSSISTFEYTVTGEQKPPVTPEDPDDPGDDKTDIWITGLEAEYYYTGAKIIPDIKVWDCDIKGNDRLLIPGVDYAAAYKNNSKVSTGSVKAEVIITGKGNYVGKGVTEKFSIVPAKGVENPVNVKGAKIDKIKDQQYNQGKAIYPDFKLTLKGKTAVTYTYNNGSYVRADGEPMDINVAVSNNVNQGKAAILVTGAQEKGKTTSVKAAFKITPIDLSKVTLDVEAKPAAYAVKGAIPVLTVKYDGKTLVNGRDYVAKYGNNKKAGVNGSVTVSGKGNYAKNAKPVSFDVKQLDMSELSVSAATVYDKVKAGRIKATVLDKAGNELKPAQYTLEVYKEDGAKYGANDVLKAGETVSIVAVAKDKVNLTGSTPKADFKVGKDISKAKFKLKKSVKKSYTGSEVELIATDFEPVTLKGASGTLEMGRDFVIVDYSNNINKGNATAIIRGIGDYSGTKTIKFKITQKTMVKGSTTPAN